MIVATLFIRPRIHVSQLSGANSYSSILFFYVVFMLFDGFTEVCTALLKAYPALSITHHSKQPRMLVSEGVR